MLDANTITLAAAGGMILLAAVGSYRSWQKAQRARDEAQAGLDERMPKFVDTITKPYQELIQLLSNQLTTAQQLAQRVMDEREKLTQQYVKQIADMQQSHDAKVEEMAKRLHGRIDDCERDRGQKDLVIARVESAISTILVRVDRIEDRERQTLRDAPSPHQPAPPAAVMPAPVFVMPGQTLIGPQGPQGPAGP